MTAEDSDLDAIKLSPAVRLSAGLHGISGVTCAIAGLQFIGMGRFETWEIALQLGLAALGVAQATAGALVLRNHHTAAIAGVLLAPILAAGALAYLFVSMSWGVATCLAWLAPPAAGTSVILSFFSLAPTRRASLAKKRLAQSGMDLGF